MKIHRFLFYLLILFLPTQLGKHFWPDWTRVFGVRLDYLSPTIYFTDFLILGILISWGIEKIINSVILRHRVILSETKDLPTRFFTSFRMTKKQFFLFSFLIFLLINCFFSQNQPAAFYKLIKIIEFSLLGFYIAKNITIDKLFNCSIATAVIYSSLIAIVQFINQGSIGGIFYWLGERSFNAGTPGIAQAIWNGQLLLRPYATFPHPNVLAGFLVISLLFIIMKNRQNTTVVLFEEKLCLFCSIILGTIVLFLTFSHVAWIVFVLGVLVLVFCRHCEQGESRLAGPRRYAPRNDVLKFIGLFVVLVFICSIGICFAPIQPESITYRQDLNLAAVKMWQSSSLMGVGLNNFLVRLPEFYQSHGEIRWFQPAHNLFLMVLSETGLIGLIGLIWFLVKTISRLLPRSEQKDTPTVRSWVDLLRTTNYQLLIIVVAILTLGLFDHYFYTLQQGQLLMTLVFGLAWSKSLQNGKM